MTLVMSRLRALEAPPSRLAIMIERVDLLEIVPVLVTFGAALGLSVLAILLALASFVSLWKHGGSGFAQAVTAALIGAGLLAYPGYLAYVGHGLPAINDITTDPVDPPRFERVARLRPPDRSQYPGLATAELQREAWPDIEPLLVNVNPKAAFDGTLAVITKRKWLIVDSRAPAPNREAHIEAIARTPIMGFRDDVVIRIRPMGEGAKVDIRSASRYGKTDFGTNAARVLALLDDIDDAATPERAERQERPKVAPKASAKPGQGGKR